ncbi:MAG: hypothetical protein ACK5PG_01530 [Lysobacterales bacterium]
MRAQLSALADLAGYFAAFADFGGIMATCFRHARLSVVLFCVLLFPCSSTLSAANARHAAEAERWTCVDYSLVPALAVFRSDSGEHVVAPGNALPGSEARLEGLSDAGATLSLLSADGRPLRLLLSRGEQIDLQQVLGALSESLDTPPSEAAADGESNEAQ